MKDDRLQLRINCELKEKAEKIAKGKYKRSLSSLVTEFLEGLVEQEHETVTDDNGVRQI